MSNSQRYFDNGLTFTSQSGSENIEFICNGDWNVSVANTIGGETWCTVTPANGKAGEGEVTVNVVENKEYDDRNVSLTLTVENIKKTIVVTQKQKDAIIISKKEYEVNSKENTIEFEVNSNIDFNVSIPSAASKWIKNITTTQTFKIIHLLPFLIHSSLPNSISFVPN